MICGDRVDNEIKTAGVLLHLILIAGENCFVGAEAERVVLFVRRRGEYNNVSSERMSKLHGHMTQTAKPDYANFLAFADAPVAHGRVRGDPRAKQRSGAREI